MVHIIHLSIKFKTILLEDNRRENLCDLGFVDDFLDIHIKTQSVKEKVMSSFIEKQTKNLWNILLKNIQATE